MGTLRFAYMDVGEGRKLGAVSLAHPTTGCLATGSASAARQLQAAILDL